MYIHKPEKILQEEPREIQPKHSTQSFNHQLLFLFSSELSWLSGKTNNKRNVKKKEQKKLK